MSTPTQTANTPDDLEAVRNVVEALTPFARGDQERILRWAMEKLGIAGSALPPAQTTPVTAILPDTSRISSGHAVASASSANIREFVAAKNPRSDNQFAAVVAYYFRFEAPADQRKEFITSDDLQGACRQAGRERLKSPISTLNNAHSVGLLDRGKSGEFTVNAVGENLVAMTLPAPSGNDRSKPTRRKSANPGKKAQQSPRSGKLR